mgnify:CR=1 FL=1
MLAGFFLSSCNSYLGKKLTKKSADDIKVEELKDECDCIEALDIIANDYLDLVGNHDKKSIREMSDEDQEALEKKAEPIMNKMGEVNDYCDEKFGIDYRQFDNGSECKLYDDLMEKVEIIEEKF